jgi:hypothetical protein
MYCLDVYIEERNTTHINKHLDYNFFALSYLYLRSLSLSISISYLVYTIYTQWALMHYVTN